MTLAGNCCSYFFAGAWAAVISIDDVSDISGITHRGCNILPPILKSLVDV
jgi:hypothetical protein